MSRRDDGGTAFPMQDPQAIHAYAAGKVEGIEGTDERDRAYTSARSEAISGLSKREYMAAKIAGHCIAGHFSHYGHESYWSPDDIAQYAIEVTDALLQALKEE